jgi:hypothetical protein
MLYLRNQDMERGGDGLVSNNTKSSKSGGGKESVLQLSKYPASGKGLVWGIAQGIFNQMLSHFLIWIHLGSEIVLDKSLHLY